MSKLLIAGAIGTSVLGTFAYYAFFSRDIKKEGIDALTEYGRTSLGTAFFGPSLHWDYNEIIVTGHKATFYCTFREPPITNLIGIGKDKLSYPIYEYDGDTGAVIKVGTWK